ncbi:MAG: ImuA family protein [Rhizobiaceae bacterium]
MFISDAPAALRLARGVENLSRIQTHDRSTFEEVRTAVAGAPLNEIMPAAPGDHAAALGFALAWSLMAAKDGVIFWSAPERDFFEDGLPNAEGLAQFGLALDRLIMVRTNSQEDALWATEQALATPEVTALCAISPTPRKALSLTATRRLLLTAEKHKTRCILLRLDSAGASAAWSRWRISAAPSKGENRELGPPVFAAHLARNRTGPSALSFNLQWDIHRHAFHEQQNGERQSERTERVAGSLAAAPADRPAASERSAA